MLKKTLIGVLFVALFYTFLIAGTNVNVTKAVNCSGSRTSVGGIIWENTTWTLENSPYIITDTVQIPENVTLTIEPGVICSVSPSFPTGNDMFLVHGTIYAIGTVNNKIIFDGCDRISGPGRPAFFSARYSGSDAFVDLEYCVIKNGASFWWGDYGHFNLRRSELVNLTYYSYLYYPGNDVYIEYNKFVNAGGFSVGHSMANVYIMYNLFKGKYADLPIYADFVVENWASYYDSETIVKYNSFIDMAGIVLKLSPGCSDAAMTATENYWGTNDTEVIDSMIYDKNDDITCAGFIEYLPILTEPHPDTPTLPLTVNFTYSPSVVYAYGAVTFNATASFGPYSSIANYTWDFGDGNTTTTLSQTVKHTYTTPDNYNVTLTVTDEFGFQNSTVISITVLEDDVPPMIEIPSRVPEGDVEPYQEVIILVNVTDLGSGIKNVTLSCLNIDKPVWNFSTVKDLNVTLCLHHPTYYYKDSVSGSVTITYPNGTAFKGAFILYILHLTDECMSTTAWITIDEFTRFYLSPPVFQFGPGNYAIGIASLSTTDGYIIESRWQVFPSVQVDAKDDSMIWIDLPMTFNSTTGLYEATIPGQPADTTVKYKIAAYDKAGNLMVDDNSGQYYVYTVIPEFPSTIILPLLMATTVIATVLLKKKRKPKPQPP